MATQLKHEPYHESQPTDDNLLAMNTALCDEFREEHRFTGFKPGPKGLHGQFFWPVFQVFVPYSELSGLSATDRFVLLRDRLAGEYAKFLEKRGGPH
jgi:hypothetical protein